MAKKQHKPQASKRLRWMERAAIIFIDPDCRPVAAFEPLEERFCTPRERRIVAHAEAQHRRS